MQVEHRVKKGKDIQQRCSKKWSHDEEVEVERERKGMKKGWGWGYEWMTLVKGGLMCVDGMVKAGQKTTTACWKPMNTRILCVMGQNGNVWMNGVVMAVVNDAMHNW